ncbi:precorrin-6A reductase [Desulfofundulus sp.]|uniref:precorrin-6A reductase n=1 Tax=Desulfofundulus sp. TaxID=2282750 RepID=UPI003C70D951
MILVLYGTAEARELISLLASSGYPVMATALTAYGGMLAGMGGAVEVLPAPEDVADLTIRMKERGIALVVDGTHPFPGPLSEMAREACNNLQIPYIRYQREEINLPDDPLIHPVDSWEEAVYEAARLGDTIFLTTGSNNLELFVHSPVMCGKRLVVRVLPDHRIIKKCQDLGFSPRDIVALHGPFSTRFNRAIFQAYRADVIVTRDSGRTTDTKIKAALALKLPVVVIKRNLSAENNIVYSCQQVFRLVQQYLGEPGSGNGR